MLKKVSILATSLFNKLCVWFQLEHLPHMHYNGCYATTSSLLWVTPDFSWVEKFLWLYKECASKKRWWGNFCSNKLCWGRKWASTKVVRHLLAYTTFEQLLVFPDIPSNGICFFWFHKIKGGIIYKTALIWFFSKSKHHMHPRRWISFSPMA